MCPWTNYESSSRRNTPLQRLPNNTKSHNVQHDSLIAMRESTPDPKSTTQWDAIRMAATTVAIVFTNYGKYQLHTGQCPVGWWTSDRRGLTRGDQRVVVNA